MNPCKDYIVCAIVFNLINPCDVIEGGLVFKIFSYG
jgi:hypothetical protein